MKKNRKYSVNVFSRILLVLLAVFYVSIFAIEAFHGHDNLIEISSSDGAKDGLADCNICAYFAHHEKEEIAVSAITSLALFIFQDCALTTHELTRSYQTDIQNFVNRGPPCLLV